MSIRRLIGLLVCLVTGLCVVCLSSCVNVEKEVSRLDADAVRRETARVRYIAHRGYCTVVEDGVTVTVGENTAEAFANAAAIDTFWGIETDVWQTADGALVCMHDKDAVEGIEDVHAATCSAVLHGRLKAAPAYHAPTFDAYLDICKAGGKVAVVEIKDPDMSEAAIDAVLAAIEARDLPATIISFHYDKVAYVREHNASIDCMLIYNRNWKRYYRRSVGASIGREALLDLLVSRRIGISVDYQYLYNCEKAGYALVDRFHRADLEVGVWTIDDPYYAIYDATVLGVDYITSNRDLGALVADQLRR